MNWRKKYYLNLEKASYDDIKNEIIKDLDYIKSWECPSADATYLYCWVAEMEIYLGEHFSHITHERIL